MSTATKQQIAACPNTKCGKAIFVDHPYSWCMKCGDPLPENIQSVVPKLQVLRDAKTAKQPAGEGVPGLGIEDRIPVVCGHCGKRGYVPREFAGKRVKCRACGTALTCGSHAPQAPHMPPPTPVVISDPPLTVRQTSFGIVSCIVPHILVCSLMGTVLLRVACSICSVPVPRLSRAWWINCVIDVVFAPILLIMLLLVATDVGQPYLFIAIALTVSPIIFTMVYKKSLGVSLGEGFGLWLVQGVMAFGIVWVLMWVLLSIF